MKEIGPHRICRSGRHCMALTGETPDRRCLACRQESHRKAQATYAKAGGKARSNDRYRHSVKGQLAEVRNQATRRA